MCVPRMQVLEVACGNLMHINDVHEADIVMLETEVAPEVFGQFSGMLNRAKEGSRLLTYLDLRKVVCSFRRAFVPPPFGAHAHAHAHTHTHTHTRKHF